MAAAIRRQRECEVVPGAEQAAAVLDPLRIRLLGALRDPNSAAGLAREFSMPRQKLNYHLRALERAGMVELVGEQRKGNCNELLFRAVARTYLISPAALGKLAVDPGLVADRFSAAYQVAVAARAIQELAVLQEGAEKAGQSLATLTLSVEVRFASAKDRTAFAEELTRAVGELAAKYHDEGAVGGRLHRMFVGVHPAVKQDENATRD